MQITTIPPFMNAFLCLQLTTRSGEQITSAILLMAFISSLLIRSRYLSSTCREKIIFLNRFAASLQELEWSLLSSKSIITQHISIPFNTKKISPRASSANEGVFLSYLSVVFYSAYNIHWNIHRSCNISAGC